MLFPPTDILAEACAVSPALGLLVLTVGVALWLFGWWTHRFWVVLTATVLAGVYGLSHAADLRAPALPVSALLALAAGMLALGLARLIGFLAAGVALLLIVHEFWPGLNQPALTFLVGGLLCLFFFPLCLMALTSFLGAMLTLTGVLMLLNGYGVLDAVAVAQHSPRLLNWSCGLGGLAGFVVQLLVQRYRSAKAKDGDGPDQANWTMLRLLPFPGSWGSSKAA